MTPETLILRTAGTNCDLELIRAFELAGATTTTLHLNELIADPARLEGFDLIGFPGGFSYGDDIAAGRIFANRLKHRLYEPLLGRHRPRRADDRPLQRLPGAGQARPAARPARGRPNKRRWPTTPAAASSTGGRR